MKKAIIFSVFLIVLSFATGLVVFYNPNVPAQFASHWDAAGQVNGYMSKFWGLFLLPLISLVMLALLLFIPKIDPKKENIKKFEKYFGNFIGLLLVFLYYIYLLTIFWNLGQKMNMIVWMAPAMALLFYYAGVLIEKSEPNWTIGIRTPWTLSSETVWRKTHWLGAILFKLSAGLMLLVLILPQIAIFLILVPILISTIVLVVYSYLLYRKEKA